MGVEINPKYMTYNKDQVQAILDAVATVEATLKSDSAYPIQSQAVKAALDALKTELLGGASASYDTLKKLEDAITAEASARAAADSAIVGEASSAYNTLKKLQDAITAEATARQAADSNLVGGASSGYNTLKKLEDKLKEEAQARQTADSNLVGGASSGYNTLKKAEDKIKAEETARQQAVSAETTARQQAVTAETNRATSAEAQLRQAIQTVNKQDYIVGPLPASGQKNKVYRVPQYADSSDSSSSDSSSSDEPEVIGYDDYMWQSGQWVLIDSVRGGIPSGDYAEIGDLVDIVDDDSSDSDSSE